MCYTCLGAQDLMVSSAFLSPLSNVIVHTFGALFSAVSG